MDKQAKAAESDSAAGGKQAAARTAQDRQKTRPQSTQAISDPRQVATVIMARMNMVNAKKDELTIAIKGLTDVTQQLARAYAEQMQLIDRLAKRVKAMEVKASAPSANGADSQAAATHNA